MIDLTVIENDIKTLEKALGQRRKDYEQAKEANLKERFGENFGCHNCAYSCCLDVGDYHTSCVKSYCIHCRGSCDEYMPSNELSEYIREYHKYDEYTVDHLNELFDIRDIMKHPELYQAAIDVMKIVDKENNND